MLAGVTDDGTDSAQHFVVVGILLVGHELEESVFSCSDELSISVEAVSMVIPIMEWLHHLSNNNTSQPK